MLQPVTPPRTPLPEKVKKAENSVAARRVRMRRKKNGARTAVSDPKTMSRFGLKEDRVPMVISRTLGTKAESEKIAMRALAHYAAATNGKGQVSVDKALAHYAAATGAKIGKAVKEMAETTLIHSSIIWPRTQSSHGSHRPRVCDSAGIHSRPSDAVRVEAPRFACFRARK